MQTRVNELSRIRALIDAASASAGGQNRMAKTIGYDPGTIPEWKRGARPCPVGAQALMAELAGLNPEEVALYALIASERNPKRKEGLFRVLGKGFAHMKEAACYAICACVIWGSSPTPTPAATLYDV